MKYLIKVIFSLFLLTSSLTAPTFQCFDNLCNEEDYEYPYPYGMDEFIKLPNPIVSTAFTIYQQNPQYMLEIAAATNSIVNAMWLEATSDNQLFIDYDSGMKVFLRVLDKLKLSEGEPTYLNLTNAFAQLNQEAVDQQDEENFELTLNDIEACYSALIYDLKSAASQIDAEYYDEEEELAIAYLLDAEVQLENLLQKFTSNSLIQKYAYYSFQPLFLNALVHLQVLNMIAFRNLKCNYANITAAQNTLNHAKSLHMTYSSLLQNYSSQAMNWRLSLIDQLNCSSDEGKRYIPCLGQCDGSYEDVQVFTYTFGDPFTNFTDVRDNYVYDEEYGGGLIGGPCNLAAVITQEYNQYTQGLQDGTASFFNSFLIAWSEIGNQFPNADQSLIQQLACGVVCNPQPISTIGGWGVVDSGYIQ